MALLALLGHCVTAVGAILLAWFLVWLRLEWIAVSRRSKALKDLPGPSYGLIGILDVVAKQKDIHRVATEWVNTYGPILRVRIMQFHVLVVADPALATYILRSKLLDKFRFQYGFLDPFLGGINLLTGPTNEHWKAVRKGVAPAFAAGNIRTAFAAIVERCETLAGILTKLGPEQTVNVDDMLLREAMDVIGRVGFDKEMNSLEAMVDEREDTSCVQLMLRCTHEMIKRFKEVHRDKTIWRSDVRKGRSLMRQFRKVIKEELLDYMKAIKPRKNSFAQLLMDTKDPKTGKPLKDHQMLPEIAALFFAGSDTTGHTGTWILYTLSQYPEVEAKVLEELDSLELLVTPERPNPRSLEFADLGRLVYLQAVIKEILRQYPPVGAGYIRINETQDISLCDGRLFVPRGTLLWIPVHGIQNTHHNWERPEEFLPERWLTPGTEYADKLPMPADFYEGWYDQPEGRQESIEDAVDPDEIAKESQQAKRYMPFSEGARNCVGQQLAKVSVVATTACLLSRFHFRLGDQMGGPEGVRSREQYTLVTGIDGGMHMHAIPRPISA
eukprot:jgi/Botrbrau1/15435/Bobra.43_2s0060.1